MEEKGDKHVNKEDQVISTEDTLKLPWPCV